MLTSNYLEEPVGDTVFVFGGQYDAPGGSRYRHKTHGWEIKLEPHGFTGLDIAKAPKEQVDQRLDALTVAAGLKEEISAVVNHLREHYDSVGHPTEEELRRYMQEFASVLPVGAKLVVILDADRYRAGDNTIRPAPWAAHYSHLMKKILATYPFATAICFSDFIEKDSEIQVGGNHYDRLVYYRMAEGITAAIRTLPAKEAEFAIAV